MTLIQELEQQPDPPKLSKVAFLKECLNALFDREVWEEVADERNRDHHIPVEQIAARLAPGAEGGILV